MTEVKRLKVSNIKVGSHDQRISEDDEKFAELVKSIGRVGLINPITVAKANGGFNLVAGHRRLEAIKRLGYPEVDCIIKEENNAVDSEITFAENFCRKPLTPTEQCSAIRDVIEQKILTISEVAAAFHRTEHWVRAQLAMCDWPTDCLEVLHNEILSVAAIANLAQIDDTEYRKYLLETATENGATARTTAAWLQAYRTSKPPEQAVQAKPLEPGRVVIPAVPQAPCLSCGDIHRTDELSHVPLCQGCIRVIRDAGQT